MCALVQWVSLLCNAGEAAQRIAAGRHVGVGEGRMGPFDASKHPASHPLAA